MQLSKRCEYGLRALIDLGIASEQGHAYVRTVDLAEHEGIPVPFLEQILAQLRQAGYLGSRRGPGGGFTLARPMQGIAIGEVMRLIEGSLGPIACVSDAPREPCSCIDPDHCGLRILMLDARSAMLSVFDRYTLADVVEITLRKMRRNGVRVPFPCTA